MGTMGAASNMADSPETAKNEEPIPFGIKNKNIKQFKPSGSSKPNKPMTRSAADCELPESPRTLSFRRRFFPGASFSQWNDWRWQLRNRIAKPEELRRILRLSQDEREAVGEGQNPFPLAITPYYISLLDPDDPMQPLRRTVVPTVAEQYQLPGESHDPLGEENDTPIPGLVHRYPDRALFLVTEYCSTYCRYCTRSRMVGRKCEHEPQKSRWDRALDYIKATPAIRDVLLSGGDPLTLSDETLEYLLSKLRHIPHVEMIRIGTKVPMVLPQRVTLSLAGMLKRYHPLYISIHATHPDELTAESTEACARLANAGIPLGSQTVLLAGINDNEETMRRLMHRLLCARVRPYYLYQCDPISGSGHFRTSVERGLEMIRSLRGHTTGYASPTYVIDAPGGGGKVVLTPDYVVGREGDDIVLKNYAGEIYRYPDVCGKPRPRSIENA